MKCSKIEQSTADIVSQSGLALIRQAINRHTVLQAPACLGQEGCCMKLLSKALTASSLVALTGCAALDQIAQDMQEATAP